MSSVFVNLSNHPSSTWGLSQITAAREYGDIILDIPFPDVDPRFDSDEALNLANVTLAKVFMATKDYDTVVVHLMGEMTVTYNVCLYLKTVGIKVVASTTTRDVIENADGSKTSRFKFVRFREY